MELWRKFSKTFRYSASSFSACFSASVLGQAQQGPFSPPQPSGLVGSVASSVSMVPSAYLRIGTLSSKKRTEAACFLSLHIMNTATIHVYLFPPSCRYSQNCEAGHRLQFLSVWLAGKSHRHFNTIAFCFPTFGAVIVSVKVTVLRLLLPSYDVVREVAIGKRGRIPFHNQLGWGIGCWNNIQRNGWHWRGKKKKRKGRYLNAEHSTTYSNASFQSESPSISMLQAKPPSYFKAKISWLCPTKSSYSRFSCNHIQSQSKTVLKFTFTNGAKSKIITPKSSHNSQWK